MSLVSKVLLAAGLAATLTTAAFASDGSDAAGGSASNGYYGYAAPGRAYYGNGWSARAEARRPVFHARHRYPRINPNAY